MIPPYPVAPGRHGGGSGVTADLSQISNLKPDRMRLRSYPMSGATIRIAGDPPPYSHPQRGCRASPSISARQTRAAEEKHIFDRIGRDAVVCRLRGMTLGLPPLYVPGAKAVLVRFLRRADAAVTDVR